MEIWDSVLQCIEKGLSQARSRHPELKVTGLGITNQRETTMAWDRTTGTLLSQVPVTLQFTELLTQCNQDVLAHQ